MVNDHGGVGYCPLYLLEDITFKSEIDNILHSPVFSPIKTTLNIMMTNY